MFSFLLQTHIFQTALHVMTKMAGNVFLLVLEQAFRHLALPFLRNSACSHRHTHTHTHTHIYIYIYTHTYICISVSFSDSPVHARHILTNTFVSILDILVSEIRIMYVYCHCNVSRDTSSTVMGTTFRITLYAAGELTCMLKNLPYASSL